MKNFNKETLKINIKYSENPHNWNNFVNFLISFIIDNDILGKIDGNNGTNQNRK